MPVDFTRILHVVAGIDPCGCTTCEHLTTSYISAIRAGREVNAFIMVFEDAAPGYAKIIGRTIASGTAGSLSGMVLAVKDNYCHEVDRTFHNRPRAVSRFPFTPSLRHGGGQRQTSNTQNFTHGTYNL